MGIDQLVDRTMRPVADAVSGFIFFPIPLFGAEMPLIVLWLVAGGLFFTVYLRFINVRGFAQALRIVSGRYAQEGDPGEISQFSALATAVSGTVGIGNMAGVAVAISTGGPGATFWLIVAGLLGMSSKFAECTLGVRVPAPQSRRIRLRRTDALPGARAGRARLAGRGAGARPLLRRRHGVRLPRHRKHVPVEPGRGDLHRHHRRRRQLLRRPGLADRPVPGGGRRPGDHRRHPVHRPHHRQARAPRWPCSTWRWRC